MLMTAPTAPVGSRRLMRVRDCATYRSKKISEGAGLRHASRGNQGEDRQADDDCGECPFHKDNIVPATCHARLAIRVYDEAGNVTETREHAGDFKER